MLVQTEVGPCVEPRSLMPDTGSMTQDDANDSSFNAIMEVGEGALLDQFGSQITQRPVDFGL
jgi:hypothetical protein